jgi:adhesin transport system outer membrane protein
VFRILTIAALASGTAVAQDVVLPAPGGAPQSIDFARDPVLGFGRGVAPTQNFLERLGKAVETHPAVSAAIADQQATQAIRTQVRAGLFPQINAQLVGARALARDFGDRSTIVESLSPRSRADASVTGDQLLWDFGATGQRIAAASDRTRAAQAEVERVAGETAFRAVSAWYDVLGYQNLFEISDASVARQRDILSDVRTRVVQGLGAGGDTSRTEAVLADAEAQNARFERLLAQARARYREAFGEDAPPRLTRSAPPISTAQSLDSAQALARQSPAVQVALRRAEAARRDYRAAKADGLPRLSAGVNGTRYDVFTGSDYEVRGTLVLRQSLFAGGRQRGVVAEAAARSRGEAFLADRVTGETERDAGAAFTDVRALARTATTLEAAYVANRRARDTYVEQFRVSRGSLIELLRAEQSYVAAATNYLQGIVELDVARYALLVRTGEILPVVGVKITAL